MINIGIFLFDDVEVLDFAGPFEVFSVTAELNDYQLLKVFTISTDGNQVTSVNGLKVQPDYSFQNHPDPDILLTYGKVALQFCAKTMPNCRIFQPLVVKQLI